MTTLFCLENLETFLESLTSNPLLRTKLFCQEIYRHSKSLGVPFTELEVFCLFATDDAFAESFPKFPVIVGEGYSSGTCISHKHNKKLGIYCVNESELGLLNYRKELMFDSILVATKYRLLQNDLSLNSFSKSEKEEMLLELKSLFKNRLINLLASTRECQNTLLLTHLFFIIYYNLCLINENLGKNLKEQMEPLRLMICRYLNGFKFKAFEVLFDQAEKMIKDI